MVLDAARETFSRIIPGFSSPNSPAVTEVKDLMNLWSHRNKRIDEWYRLLRMEDILKTNQMESFVGNDPRTTWNMATYLLRPRPLTHEIVTTDGSILPVGMKPVTDLIERYFNRVWQNIDRQDIIRGKQSWFHTLVGFLTATGWYAMPFTLQENGRPWVDYWNPQTVYPDFGDDLTEGTIRLARVRIIHKRSAERLIKQNNWNVSRGGIGNRVFFARFWKKEDTDVVVLRTILGNSVVSEQVLRGFTSIPVMVGQTGGIPGFNKEGEQIDGQSILATNEPLFGILNRQMTFLSQLVRDTANPISFEKSTGKQIVTDPDGLYRRGAHYRMGINDDMGFINKPPIPVELNQILFRITSMMGKGAFSDLTFGSILQEVSASLISQAAEGAMQLLDPYHSLLELGVSEVSTHWYWGLLNNPGLRPPDWPDIDVEQLEGTRMESKYTIKIPGDLTNRVNMAKTLNPNFRLPSETVLSLLLPEVASPAEALAQLDGEKAKERPEYQMVQLVHAFEQLAREAGAAGNRDNAAMYTVVASNLRQQLTQIPQAADRANANPANVSLAQLRSGVNGNQ